MKGTSNVIVRTYPLNKQTTELLLLGITMYYSSQQLLLFLHDHDYNDSVR